jgi:hypothetical protein
VGSRSSESNLDVFVKEARKPGGKCSVGVYLRDTSKAKRQELLDALAAPMRVVPGAAIARVLKRRGVDVGAEAIQRHRRGDCACGRS